MSNLDSILKALNKKYGEGTIVRASEAKALNIERIPTGSLTLDIVTGGGIPENRVSLIAGQFSSGKTAIALKIVANAQIKFKERYERLKERGVKATLKKAVWIDAEGSFDEEWAVALGIDVNSLIIVKPEYGEQALDIADVLLKSGECGIIVIDSIACLVPKGEADESMEKLFMGDLARMMNKFFRKITAGMNNQDITNPDDKAPTILLINQYREKIGVLYGSSQTLPGGKGQEYAASVILEVKRGDWIEVKQERNGVVHDEIVGQWIKVFCVKNKTAPPKKSGQVRFFFNDIEGYPQKLKGQYDVLDEVVRYASFYGFIKRRGSYYYLDGMEKGFQGQDSLIQYLRDYPDIVEDLRRKVLDLVFRPEAKRQAQPELEELITGEKEKGEVIVLDEVKTETL